MEYILLIILFRYLQKDKQTQTIFPDWGRWFYIGMIASIALLILEFMVDEIRVVTVLLGHGTVFALFYLSMERQEFQPIKGFVYPVLPLMVINFLNEFMKLISPSFYDILQTYFESAMAFAWVWLIAMWIINRKQRKALEQERLKAVAKEMEFKNSQLLKAELERQVAERTVELTQQKEELQQTLHELKAAQEQLIHAEKMASLGELTAGIAHEIQNPLNFVNNFSELNQELIAELKEELDKGNVDEVKLLVQDIAGNEAKINHHGKRADSIVKGMLEHSRSSAGEKEPTDINALADEYLRLSYHGLRAKDKSFNADFKTEFDLTLPPVKVVPQDMGRVLLNLINNAFYACSERSKKEMAVDNKMGKVGNVADSVSNFNNQKISPLSEGVESFSPRVIVSSKKSGNKVEVSVSDNGTGIPKEIKDKIFQPFFTTKPTGVGTGLGLSLSYDIVKAHRGNLKVESKDGVGTKFTIILPL
jgi:signal transduction histidine kinase